MLMRSGLRFTSLSLVAAVCCAIAARAQDSGPAGKSTQPRSALFATPQGKLVLAFYQAGRAGDDDALRRCLTGEAARGLEGARALDNFRAMMKAPAPVITKVTVNGTRADVDASYAPPAPASIPSRSSLPPDLGVTTVTGTSTYGAGPPSSGDPPLGLVYPRTPSQAQQDQDRYDLDTRQLRVAPMPTASAKGFVDHFQLTLVGTEWKIQKVERKTK